MRGTIIVIALLCSGCVDLVARLEEAKVVERDEKRFPASGKPEVSVSTFDGSIEIRPWDKAEVEVIVEKYGPSKESVADIVVNASQSGNRVTVDVTSPRRNGFHFGSHRYAKLIVSVPKSTDIAARSSDGSIDIERVNGRVELRSGDGSIRARDLRGDVNAHTGDGSISLEGQFAGLRARSGDGSVRIHAAGATGSADWDVNTGDGSITLELPGNFNGDLDAHTGDGRVRVEDVEISGVSGELRRNSLKGRLGAGGRQVRLRTGDGSIVLRRF